MTSLYKENRSLLDGSLNGIIRYSDGAYIPIAPGNTDYEAYLAWAAVDGNVADPCTNYTPDAIKSRKWDDIKNQRDARKAGGVLVDGFWIHTDDSSRIQWLGIKDTARDSILAGGKMTDTVQMMGKDLIWKTLDNQFVKVSNQLAYDVVQATKNLDAILFAQAEQKHTEVNSSTAPAMYDTTTGWNKTYAESI